MCYSPLQRNSQSTVSDMCLCVHLSVSILFTVLFVCVRVNPLPDKPKLSLFPAELNMPLFLTAVMCVSAILFVCLFTICLLGAVKHQRSHSRSRPRPNREVCLWQKLFLAVPAVWLWWWHAQSAALIHTEISTQILDGLQKKIGAYVNLPLGMNCSDFPFSKVPPSGQMVKVSNILFYDQTPAKQMTTPLPSAVC